MEIRLRGTPAETDAALAAIRRVLTVTTASRPHPDRPPSHTQRIYVTATAKGDRL